MCDCIKELKRLEIVQENALKHGQYFIYSTGKFLKKTPFLVRYCPNCGESVYREA